MDIRTGALIRDFRGVVDSWVGLCPTFANRMMFMIRGYNGPGGGGWPDNVPPALPADGK